VNDQIVSRDRVLTGKDILKTIVHRLVCVLHVLHVYVNIICEAIAAG